MFNLNGRQYAPIASVQEPVRVKNPATTPPVEQFVEAGFDEVVVYQISAELSERVGGVAHRIATLVQIMKIEFFN